MLTGRKESEKDQGKALFSLVSPLAISPSPFQVCDYFCTLTLSMFNIPTHKLYSFWYTHRVAPQGLTTTAGSYTELSSISRPLGDEGPLPRSPNPIP